MKTKINHGKPHLWVMLPAYNEKENLVKLLPDLYNFLKNKVLLHTIVIIDDGSTDSTRNLAQYLGSSIPLKIISHEVNKGIGEVFKTGFSEISRISSEEDYVIVLEADGTSDYTRIPLMYEKMQVGNDIVIASRYIRGGAYKNFPLKRHMISRLGNAVLSMVFRKRNIKDYTIFFRGYKMRILRKGLVVYGKNFITSGTFLANTEILLNLAKLTDYISEIPFVYSYDKKIGKSKMPLFKTLIDYFRFLIVKFFRHLP